MGMGQRSELAEQDASLQARFQQFCYKLILHILRIPHSLVTPQISYVYVIWQVSI